MIKIIIIIFIFLAIIGLIKEYWKEIACFLAIAGFGYLIFNLIGLKGIVILVILGCAIIAIVKSFKKLIKRLKINKCKLILRPYILNMKIETYDSIMKNTNLLHNTEAQTAFAELAMKLNLCSEMENGEKYYIFQTLRDNIKMNNYNAIVTTIDNIGMADYSQLVSNSRVENNWFVAADIENLCKENKIIKEVIPTANSSKGILYKSIHFLDKSRRFSNYTVKEINLD